MCRIFWIIGKAVLPSSGDILEINNSQRAVSIVPELDTFDFSTLVQLDCSINHTTNPSFTSFHEILHAPFLLLKSIWNVILYIFYITLVVTFVDGLICGISFEMHCQLKNRRKS